MKQTHFFLGANSAEGFYGLYDQLLDARLYDLIILKGTPGCDKSTFMRRVAAALEERGLERVYIHCSGDPDSLDGVIFPAIGDPRCGDLALSGNREARAARGAGRRAH